MQSRKAILESVADLHPGITHKELLRRQHGVALVLDWLAQFGGSTWQQQWLSSSADAAGKRWTELVPTPGLIPGADWRAQLTGGATRLVLLRVVRPSYNWLYQWRSPGVTAQIRDCCDPHGFELLDPLCDQIPRFTERDRGLAYIQLGRILFHNGGRLGDITVSDCIEAYRAQVGYSARQHSHWYFLLKEAGILPSNSPPSIWAAGRRGQLTVEELVDGYQVDCRPVRDLFVDYLHERQPGLDYSSIRQLVTKLVLLFWRDLELHEPGLDSLHLSDRAVRAWKERLKHVAYGNHRIGEVRQDRNAILMAVRGFYSDLNHWALEDPSRWGGWAAPNPITTRDLGGQNKQIRHVQARMHQRTRELVPLLPALVATAAKQRRHASDVLATGMATQPGEPFEVDGRRLVRVSIATDPERGGSGRPGVIYADDLKTGHRLNITLEEDDAFWAWSVVEVLRQTGVRIEELLELTHNSFVAYTLPTTGEVIPLLQITPSKTDRERLLVVSPELAEVLAIIIQRVAKGTERVPLVTRYDQAERVHSSPLPYLFQRPSGLINRSITKDRVRLLLDRTASATGLTAHDGQPVRITPHDFRRVFATEAVASGLPIHIAAKLLGHETLATTQRYVAIYDNDVIEHHRGFIARRRALRPSEEYREPTDAEWDEFLAHFEKRKVELGVCGRAYGTPCIHEHACLRCPMLRPDPNQQPRLIEIRENLHARLAEARKRGWMGEIEGLNISLAGAEQKLAGMLSAKQSSNEGEGATLRNVSRAAR